MVRLSDGVTRKDKHTHDWKCVAAILGRSPRKIREVINPKESGEARLRPSQLAYSMPPRKTSSEQPG